MTCETCKHWTHYWLELGYCLRHPKRRYKHREDRCGEWITGKKAEKPKPGTFAYDVETQGMMER